MCKIIQHEEIKANAVYTIPEVAKLLRISAPNAWMRRHKKRPMPKSFRIGRRIFTRGSAILEFMQEREK